MHSPSLQRGMALVSALLLLLVVTILSVGMFRSFGLQEHLAGNARDKARATHAAESAQSDTEGWLLTNANTIAAGSVPTGTNCSGHLTSPQVCSNLIQNVNDPPNWGAYQTYQPTNFGLGSVGDIAQAPWTYISYLAQNYNSTSGTQTVAYQVDATSTGASTSTVSVVESTYMVSITYNARNDSQKFVYEGGP